jgi:hypothetical protein
MKNESAPFRQKRFIVTKEMTVQKCEHRLLNLAAEPNQAIPRRTLFYVSQFGSIGSSPSDVLIWLRSHQCRGGSSA